MSEISCCPECESSWIRREAKTHNRCEDCGLKFETCKMRERRNHDGSHGRSGATKRLIDADPDDWPQHR